MFSLYTLAYATLMLGGVAGLVVAARRLETDTPRPPRRERMHPRRFLLVLALAAPAVWLSKGWVVSLAQRALLDFWILLPLFVVYGFLAWILFTRVPPRA